ncbi:MAG TPA: aminotransferase class V-fold PLP-dependent enzyme, partial [Lacibacter sp.]|nr:aminotransferase class V-fold PLP-dependent enzyme [Lacibacter sp.]
MQYPIYLDYNATTPCDPRVMDEMLPYFTSHFGNAASKTHAYGWVAEETITIARERVARLISAGASELIFTSGSTESVNLAMRGVYETYQSKGNHIITYQTEHKAVLDTCAYLEKQGAMVTYLPVDENGLPDLLLLEKSIQPDTILIAAMYANNETGVLFPIREMTAIAKEKGVLFFSDATQAVGKIPVDVLKDEIDLLALSAH